MPYSVVDISLESDLDYDGESDIMMIQRDSGISTNSQQEANNNGYSVSTNSLPMISGYHLPQQVRGHQKTSSNPEEFLAQQHAQLCQMNSSESMESPAPPALPPKGFVNNPGYDEDESFTDSTSESLPLPPLPPIQQHFANENGNCQTVPCCDYEANQEILPCCVPTNNENDCEECFCDNPPPPPPTNQSCC
jgi:hypothetical protein